MCNVRTIIWFPTLLGRSSRLLQMAAMIDCSPSRTHKKRIKRQQEQQENTDFVPCFDALWPGTVEWGLMLSVALLCCVRNRGSPDRVSARARALRKHQNIQHCIEASHPPSKDIHLYCYSLLRLLQDEQYSALRLQLQKTPHPPFARRCLPCHSVEDRAVVPT